MKSKWCILGCALILSALIVSGCGSATVEPTQVPTAVPTESSAVLPNPASVYCEEQGYTLEMRTDADGGQYGVCIFPDGSECDEWALFRGECSPAGAQPPVQPLEPAQALDMALAYIREHFDQAPAADMTWMENPLPDDELLGSETIEYISDDGEWTATLSYPVVAPEAVVYEVVVTGPAFRLRWAVKVDAAGQMTGSLAPSSAEPVACLYGRVESSPGEAAIDDYLILLPEEARRALDVVGADETIEAQIEELRDSTSYAHFWGLLDCDLPYWGGCRLVVTRLRPEGSEGPIPAPDPVEGWMGAISSLPGEAQFDDYLVKRTGYLWN